MLNWVEHEKSFITSGPGEQENGLSYTIILPKKGNLNLC